MLERTEALVAHLERAVPRAPHARAMTRVAGQLRSFRRLVVRRRVVERAGKSPASMHRAPGATPEELSTWKVARPSVVPSRYPAARIGPGELPLPAPTSAPATFPDGIPAPQGAGEPFVSLSAPSEMAALQAAPTRELFRVQRAAARTRRVAPEVSAQRSGARNGVGGPQAPPTQLMQAAVQQLAAPPAPPTQQTQASVRQLAAAQAPRRQQAPAAAHLVESASGPGAHDIPLPNVPSLSPRALRVARHASTEPAATSPLAGNGLATRRTDPSSGPERTAPEWSTRTDELAHPSPAADGLAEARHLSRLADEMEAILRADARRHGIDV
jgi:hypothetical protein